MSGVADYKGTGRRVLMLVQNLPVPFDRRVWQEATTLARAGYTVSVICPKGRGHEKRYEYRDNVHIHRHPLPWEAKGTFGYALEYSLALFWEWALAWKVLFTRGFDLIHACNPPDTIFLIAGFFKYFLGRKFLFDHHDINPELYEAKFGRRGVLYRLTLMLERLTFATADISIATNESYREIAIRRGKMAMENVFVVRSGPDPARVKIVAGNVAHKKGKRFLIGYVGVIGRQEGIQYLIQAARHILYTVRRTDMHFVIIGDGPALDEMKALAVREKVADAITFTGRVDDPLLLEILSTADICVNPDEVNPMNDKSTMNKIMEYMALGKPIVQFDVTEGKRSAGGASLYAKANDAHDFAAKIIALLDDPSLRAAMGNEGRRRIEEELAWHYEAPKLLAAYEAIFSLPQPCKKYTWLYHRLRAMNAPEIAFRCKEAVKRKWDKLYYCHCRPSRPGGNDKSFLGQSLKEKITACSLSPETEKKWRSQYEQTKSGTYSLLGACWPGETSPQKWHLDPISKRHWPDRAYCFDIRYRYAPLMGDVKYVWELSRLQYLQPIAALAYRHNDKAMAQFCLRELESWIDGNPHPLGIHWASGIEMSLRAVSMVMVVTWLQAHISQELSEKINASLHLHGCWIARYRSAYSSANNHRIAEALGSLIIGAACPQFAESQQWKRIGWRILGEEIRKQILDDGTGAERSVAYTQFALQIFTLGLWLARSSALTVPEDYCDRIKRARHWLCCLRDKAGNYPNIGDNDNGAVIPEPELRALFVDSGHPAPPLRQGVYTFAEGGYSVARFTSGKHALMLAVDHGELGYLSIAAHGHADALALWLHMDGQPVFVDAGTYLYHSGGAWRDYFRSTSAHNTLAIAGASSSTMAGAFNWSHKARATLQSSRHTHEEWQMVATHDGYRKSFNATHRRALNVLFSEGCVVEDSLICDRPQEVEIAFLIHPDVNVAQMENEIHILKEGLLLRMRHEGPLYTRIGRPGTGNSGWYSDSFGHKRPAVKIVFYGALSPGQPAFTHLAWA